MTQGSVEDVLGHYSVLAGGSLQPLLQESSPIFAALVSTGALPELEALLAPSGGLAAVSNRTYNVLHWSTAAEGQPPAQQQGRAAVTVKSRTLLALAAYHGSVAIVRALLSAGADPLMAVSDGTTAFTMAQHGEGPARAEVLGLLQAATKLTKPKGPQSVRATSHSMGNSISQGSESSSRLDGSTAGSRLDNLVSTSPSLSGLADGHQHGREDSNNPVSYNSDGTGNGNGSNSDNTDTQNFSRTGMDLSGLGQVQRNMDQPHGQSQDESDPYNAEGLPYSTSELVQPEFSTDDFRMFAFKVVRCCKRFAHDWRACPFMHPTENARRRDPREQKYCAIACPNYKQGFCVRGDLCPYAHGVFEAWLHPSRYRTQLCKDGATCHRPVCFFAHSLPELRAPTHTWVPCAEDVAGAARANAANLGLSADEVAQNNSNTNCAPTSAPLAYTHSHANDGGDHGNGNGNGHSNRHQPTPQALAGHGHGPPPHAHAHPHQAPHHHTELRHQSTQDSSASVTMTPSSSSTADSLYSQSQSQIPVHGKRGSASGASGNGAMFGFTAPRMSNAFARRHGLNPKDNAMLNLQKIAIQAHVGSMVPGMAPTSNTGTERPQAACAASPFGAEAGVALARVEGAECEQQTSQHMTQMPSASYYAPSTPTQPAGVYSNSAGSKGSARPSAPHPQQGSLHRGGWGNGSSVNGMANNVPMNGMGNGDMYGAGPMMMGGGYPQAYAGQQAVGSSAAPNGGTTNVQLQLLNNQLGALNLQAQAQHQGALAAAFAAGQAIGVGPMYPNTNWGNMVGM